MRGNGGIFYHKVTKDHEGKRREKRQEQSEEVLLTAKDAKKRETNWGDVIALISVRWCGRVSFERVCGLYVFG